MMTAQRQEKSSDFPNQFQRETLKLLHSLIDLSSAAFYLLNPDMSHRGAAFYNMGVAMDTEYTRKFKFLDPLDPRKFRNKSDLVVTLDEQMPFSLLRQTIYFQEYMQPHGHRYVADMFFRQDGEIIAVLSMLRHESARDFSDRELSLLRTLQPYLEFTLNTIYLPQRVEERMSMQEKYGLTRRELDVLELVIAGDSNKQLSEELGISLGTIKTHLGNIFVKTGVSTRTELLSKIISDLSRPG